MASSTRPGEADDERQEIRLVEEDDGWVAHDVATGVASQGETRPEALENLDEALTLHEGEGRPPADEELREVGIDPEDNTTGDTKPPEFMQ